MKKALSKRRTTVLASVISAVLLFALLTVGVVAAESQPKNVSGTEINVWLIGGQSNAVGYGDNEPTEAADDPRYYIGFDNTLYYGVHENPKYNPDDFVKLSIGNGSSGKRSGAELGIAKALDSTGKMNAVIKGAWGSTSLYPNLTASISTKVGTWTSPSYIERANMEATDPDYQTSGTYIPWGSETAVDIPNVDTSVTISDNVYGYAGEVNAGNMYKLFIETVAEGVAKLIDMGYTPVLRGMWWMQGEAESNSDVQSALYDELLECLVNDIRTEMNDIFGDEQGTEMPFVCGNIYRPETKNADGTYVYTQPKYLAHINDAQEIVAKKLSKVYIHENGDDDEGSQSGATVVAKDGYTDQPFFGQQDSWHFNVQTQQYFGEKFVEYALGATNEYTVTVNGRGISFTGGGIYKSGSSVTVEISCEENYSLGSVMMSVGGADATEITLTDGAYTFTVGEASVAFTANTTYTGELITTEYGTITADYVSAEDYPFAVFKNGAFVKGYAAWRTAMQSLPATDNTDNYVVLLRRDYETRMFDGDGASIATNLGGTLTVDLGGHSLTRGANGYIFDIFHNSSRVYDTVINVKNGNIITVSNAPVIGLNYNAASAGYNSKTYNFTFDSVRFINRVDSLTMGMITDCWENGKGTANTGIQAKLIFNNCIFDMGNAKNAIIMRFSGGVTNTKVSATVNGGNIISASNNVSIAVTDSEDTLRFGAYNGNYTTLTLPLGTEAPGTNYFNTEEVPYSFTVKDGEVNENNVIYTLSENSLYVEGYGIISKEFQSCVFAIFDKKGFVTGADTWGAATLAAKNAANSSSERWAAVYLRTNYTNDSDSGDRTPNILRLVNGTIVVDLGKNTLTRNNCTLFDMYSSAADAEFTTKIEIKNGTLATKGGAIMAFDVPSAVNKVKKVYEIKVEDVTYKAEAGASLSAPLAYTVWANKNTSVGMDVDIEYTNVTFDMTGGNGYHIFKASDVADGRSGQVNISFVMKGGQVLNVGKSWIAQIDSADGGIFGKYNGKYPTFTIETGKKPYDGGGSTNGNVSTFGSVEKNKLRLTVCTPGDTYDTYSFSVSEYTPYAYISFDESGTEAAKPYAVFAPASSGYRYDSAYSSWNAAIARATKASGSVVYLRADAKQADHGNFSHNFGTVTVDLNGHKLYRTKNYIVNTYFTNTSEQSCSIVFKNGTLVNSSEYTSSNGMFCINYAVSNTALAKLDLTFNNVSFVNEKTTNMMFTLWENGYSTAATVGSKTTATFNNCTIDYNGSKLFVLLATGATASNKSDIDVIINGGTILSDVQIDTSKLYNKNADDSVRFGKYEGNYTRILLPGSVAYPAYSIKFEGTAGEELTYVLSETVASNKAYDLLPSYNSKYGKIPARYDAQNYPFAVFKNGSFYGAYANWGIDGGDSALSESKAAKSIILMRRDFVYNYSVGYNNFSQTKTDILFDLGGYTFTNEMASYSVFNAQAKATSGVVHDTSIQVINGTFLTKTAAIIRVFQTANDSYNASKTFKFTFENVTFGFAAGATEKNVLVYASNVPGAPHDVNAEIILNNCTLDMKTNAPSGVRIASIAEAAENANVSIVINGGTIKADAIAANSFFGYFGSGDSMNFAKLDGSYTEFVLPSGAAAPAVTVNNGEFKLVKVSDNGTETSYTLMPAAAVNLNLKPKTSITLGSELVYNIYIPAADYLKSYTVDGATVEDAELVTVDSIKYYLVKVSLPAKEAARKIVLKATVTVSGKDYTGTWTVSVPKYAAALLEVSTNEAEKTLVRDVLQYVREAYAYFGTTDAEQLAKIDTLLGEYSSKPTSEGSALDETTGLKSATFVLDGTPSMRFYLADGANASDYVFFIGGKQIDTIVSADGTYVDTNVYAYELCETVTYTVDGENGGSFHINAYYSYVSGDKYTAADKAELVALTESFWRYLQSARAYRDSVVEG